LYSSVAAVVGLPPNANADVLLAPAPPEPCLAVLKLETVVQVDPSYSSVAPVSRWNHLPPNAKADVCIPAPANNLLAVFKPVGFEVQADPSYSSVATCRRSSSTTKS
jgi:hypothetical protein